MSYYPAGYLVKKSKFALKFGSNKRCDRLTSIQWTPLIMATSGPALSGHNNRWLSYPALLLHNMYYIFHKMNWIDQLGRLHLISNDLMKSPYFLGIGQYLTWIRGETAFSPCFGSTLECVAVDDRRLVVHEIDPNAAGPI